MRTPKTDQELYIDAIILARRWRDEAIQSNSDEYTIKAFNRILTHAIDQYEALFGNINEKVYI